MRLYHGTVFEYAKNIMNNGIDVTFKKSQRGTDFGAGFYTTNFYELAEKTAKVKSAFFSRDNMDTRPVVIEMNYDISLNKKFFSKNLIPLVKNGSDLFVLIDIQRH